MHKASVLMMAAAVFLAACNTPPTKTGNTAGYTEAVAGWESHEDVANWLDGNFRFDTSRQREISKRLKSQGPDGLLVRSPEKLFRNSSGYCADSANFALQNLNRIDPDYRARWVFVENAKGRPNHWVTAFDYRGNLYVMDYGAGRKWSAMNGTHGPYDSLADYRAFLASLSVPGFKVGDVYYRDMPGQED